MSMPRISSIALRWTYIALTLFASAALPSGAADHGDTPLLTAVQREDAKLTDLFAFVREDRLVLAMDINPSIPAGVDSYVFPSDATFRLHLDNASKVSFRDPEDLEELGGTVRFPLLIQERVVFEITFDEDGRTPRLRTKGLPGGSEAFVRLFTGLRDDPFIRRTRIGRNVASIVLELPLSLVLRKGSTLLVWGTSEIPTINGSQVEHAGRALRSQFPENDGMNLLHPRFHRAFLGVAPDVLIFDTAQAAAFPNGRELTDDVVDLVGRPLANEEPSPEENDVPFLDHFPYLAPPH